MRQLEDDLWTDLTERQEQVLNFVEDCIINNQMPPTRAEIANHFGKKSVNWSHEILVALARKGRIILLRDVARGIRLVTA